MHDTDQPTPDLARLHPDHVRIGRAGIFALDMNYTTDTAGQPRLPVGFIGVLIDVWNGWAVFRCTRDVADAIITDQRRARDTERARLTATAMTGEEVEATLNETIPDMYWDGDDVVTDNRAGHGDTDAFTRSSPDEHGHYVINGWDWTWTPVDPADCDRVAGTAPALGDEIAFIPLLHTDMTVPPASPHVRDLHTRQTPTGTASLVTLCRDGAAVAVIETDAAGDPIRLYGSRAFTAADLTEFINHCRLRGRTPTGNEVLRALVDEYQITAILEFTLNRGGTLARQRDRNGETVTEIVVIPEPSDPSRRSALATQVLRDYPHPRGIEWQIWRRGAWRFLARVTTSDTV